MAREAGVAFLAVRSMTAMDYLRQHWNVLLLRVQDGYR